MAINTSTSGSVHIVTVTVVIIVLLATLGLVFWKNVNGNNTTASGIPSAKSENKSEWLTYDNGEWPFIFDYPKDWVTVEEEETVYFSNLADERTMSIAYVKMLGGLSRGVSICQIKRESSDEHCSYIDNDLVGYFFGSTEANEWTGVLEGQNADIRLQLISKDQSDRHLLEDVAKSIRRRS